MKRFISILVFILFIPAGCEDTDLRLVTEAGIEAVQALTLSHEEVVALSEKAARQLDEKHDVAPPENPYARRLSKLVAQHRKEGGHSFSFKVYLSPTVNAFALGDGSIRFYSGLMDRMSDGELRFVIGHEMGHVVEEHVKRKMELALAASAVRKGIASQRNIVGEIARSALGSFINSFLTAQFSQEEEKAADIYALHWMKEEGYDPQMAIAALEELAALGGGHSFLSSHPAPAERVEHLETALRDPSALEDQEEGLLGKVWGLFSALLGWVLKLLGKLLALFS
jgi:putative metalloprotease